MTSSLFRPEVLQARRQHWLGAVALDQPPAMRWLALLVVLACAGVGVGLARGEYTRRTAVSGVLVPSLGVSTVVAPVAGVVTRVDVAEGGSVLAGAALATIAIPGATTLGATGESLSQALQQRRATVAESFAAQRRRLDAEVDGVQQQLALGRAELAGLEEELTTRRRQLALSESTLRRFRTLHTQRYVTDLQLQQQESAALEQIALAQALEQRALAMHRQLAQFEQALATAPQQRAQLDAEAARELALLAQEAAQVQARRDAVVPAPLAGRIATLLVQPGQVVQAGQPLASLLPVASTLEAHLYVPGSALGFVTKGDAVLLRYAAYPYQKFGQHPGLVLRVSGVALPAGEGEREPLFRVVVAPTRQQVHGQTLRAGLRLDAHLLGERRRLWEWVFEPLQTLRASVAGDARAASNELVAARGAAINGEPRGPARATSAGALVGHVVAAARTIAASSRRPHTAAAAGAASSGHRPGIAVERSATDVGLPTLAADPGTHAVLCLPADGGRQEGACDA